MLDLQWLFPTSCFLYIFSFSCQRQPCARRPARVLARADRLAERINALTTPREKDTVPEGLIDSLPPEGRVFFDSKIKLNWIQCKLLFLFISFFNCVLLIWFSHFFFSSTSCIQKPWWHFKMGCLQCLLSLATDSRRGNYSGTVDAIHPSQMASFSTTVKSSLLENYLFTIVSYLVQTDLIIRKHFILKLFFHSSDVGHNHKIYFKKCNWLK